MSSQESTGAGSGERHKRSSRFRGAELDQAISAAARKILAERGYDALNFDAVAREAGVSRPTLYRRWPNKAKLLEELTVQGDGPLPASLQSDSLRAALASLLRSVAHHYMEPWIRPATLGLIASAPSLQQYPTAILEEAEIAARCGLTSLVEEAKAKGMMRKDVDADAFYDLAVGPILYRTLFSYHRTIDDRHLGHLLDMILKGVQP